MKRSIIKKTKTTFLALSTLVLLSACEDQFLVKLDRPETEQKAVAFCIIEEGQTEIKCQLTKANAIFGEPPRYYSNPEITYIEDASITISGNGESFELGYDAVDKIYKVNVPPSYLEKLKEYTLLINSPSEGILTSSTTIPELGVNNIDLSVDSIFIDNGYWEYEEYLPKVVFTDDLGEGDIYNLRALCSFDTAFQGYNQVGFEVPYIVDETKDGSQMERIGRLYKYEDHNYLKFNVVLQKVTKDYMLYHQSVQGSAFYYEDDPFSEPVISYSNIEGGLGLFAGVAVKQFSFLID